MKKSFLCGVLALIGGFLFITKVNASDVSISVEKISSNISEYNRYNVSGTGTLSLEEIEEVANENGFELLESDEIYITGDITISDGEFNVPISLVGSLKVEGGKIFAIAIWNEFEGKLEITDGLIENLEISNITFDNDKIQIKGGKITDNFIINTPERLDFLDTINKIIPSGYKMSESAWQETVVDEYYTYSFYKGVSIEKINNDEIIEKDNDSKEDNNKEEDKKTNEDNVKSNNENEKNTIKEIKTTKVVDAIINFEKELSGGSILDFKEVLISNELQKSEKNLRKIYNINVLDKDSKVMNIADNKMKITITLGNDLKSYKAYEIVYIKNGKVEQRIPATIEDGKLIFYTDHLSEYGIVAYNTVKTGDNILLYVLMLGISLVGISLAIFKKIEQRN